MNLDEYAIVGRLALAALLGGLIGLERETHGQSAGLRTHMVVAIGSCLMMLVSIYMVTIAPDHKADPGRIAAQVVSGIGFLGAGAILRFGTSIKGLTTAACLWSAAGIGLAAGCGFFVGATVATLLTLVSIFIFDRVEKTFLVGRRTFRLIVTAADAPGLLARIEEALRQNGLHVQNSELQRDLVRHRARVTLNTVCPVEFDVESVSHAVGGIADIETIEIA